MKNLCTPAPVVWTPSGAENRPQSQLRDFMKKATDRGLAADSVSALYEWSTHSPELFWPLVWDFVGITASSRAQAPFVPGCHFFDTTWFPGATLNFAENLLRYRDDREALVAYREDGQRRVLTFAELAAETARVAEGLRRFGLKAGDRVAALMPNVPETTIFMLAAASLGAIFSSASPDFGISGVVERFGQITPRVLLTVDGYWFKGKAISIVDRVREIVSGIPSIEAVVEVAFINEPSSRHHQSDRPEVIPFTSFGDAAPLAFEQLPFDAPLCILFSSGTTGKPKGILHRAGGVLLEHLKEHILHGDLRREDTIFYQTTCGWMMWNWLVSALAVGSRVVLYDGSPLMDDGRALFTIAEREQVTVFGTNAKFLRLLESSGTRPNESRDLSSIRTILSTGSPLLPDQYDFVAHAISSTAQLCSISGGTDIVGCFALGCPDLPVYRGELQIRSLGLAVEVWNERGDSIVGERGELVCTRPFPSMPLRFWNDPDNTRFKAAYFERFPGVWHHGDYVEVTPRGGMIFYGRSDAVLNPGGVRIGTAEIYREVERIPTILDCVAVGQRWDDDERIVLFVVMAEGEALTQARQDEIRATIRAHASPFHVPRKIIAVPDIPRTRSGKITELAIKQTIHGEPIKNVEALANPEALRYFSGIAELTTE